MPPAPGNTYPFWKFYPSHSVAPGWVAPVVRAFAAAAGKIDSRTVVGVKSDAALAALRPALVKLGFEVEAGKKKHQRSRLDGEPRTTRTIAISSGAV
jgi:hypothetical protein